MTIKRISPREIIAIHDALTASELCLLLAIGGTLPRRARDRRRRMAEAVKLNLTKE